jgi:hypothetical protein
VVTISKQYADAKGKPYFWFAYHSDWDNFLSEAGQGLYVLGCIGRDEAFALPFGWIHQRMQYLNVTKTENKTYCHVFLYPTVAGGLALWLVNGNLDPLDEFRIALSEPPGANKSA